jgi:hypothetical protein
MARTRKPARPVPHGAYNPWVKILGGPEAIPFRDLAIGARFYFPGFEHQPGTKTGRSRYRQDLGQGRPITFTAGAGSMVIPATTTPSPAPRGAPTRLAEHERAGRAIDAVYQGLYRMPDFYKPTPDGPMYEGRLHSPDGPKVWAVLLLTGGAIVYQRAHDGRMRETIVSATGRPGKTRTR